MEGDVCVHDFESANAVLLSDENPYENVSEQFLGQSA